MKWILAGVLTFLALAAGALFAVPRMVDWNAYRPDIALLVSGMTGRQLSIDGDVRLVLLPTPTLSASGVRLRNIDGASAPDMIKLKSLDARVALTPLLKGRVVVESMVLVEPDVLLERLPDGRPNWQFLRPPTMDFVDDLGDDLAVNRLIVVGGSVSFTNAGRLERLTGINAEIMAERLAGPFRVQGDVTWRGLPWRVDVGSGRFAPLQTTSVSATVGLRGGGSEARFNGAATLAAQKPILAGTLRGDLARFRDILAAMELPLPPELAQRASIEASVTLDEERLGLEGLSIRMADARVTGSAVIPLAGGGSGAATLKVGLIDLDKWPAAPASDGASVDLISTLRALSRIAPGRWSVQGEGLRSRDTLLRDWRLQAELAPGSMLLREASGHLPGGTDLTVYGLATLGEAPGFKGAVEFGTEAIRLPWAWLGLPLPPADPDRLRQASLTANIAIAADSVAIDDLKLRLDSSRIDGAVSVRLGARPMITAALSLDTVNIGAYWPTGLPVSADTAALLRRFDAMATLRTGPITFGETALDSVDLQAELRDGGLSIGRAALALNGDLLTVTGGLGNQADPALDMSVTGAVADLRPWLRLLGMDAPQADLGAASGKLALTGSLAAPRIRGEAAFADGEVKATGTILFSPALELELSATGAALPRFLLRLAPELGFVADVSKPMAMEVRAKRAPNGWRVERGELGLGVARIAASGLWASVGMDADLSLHGLSASAATIAAVLERAKTFCCVGNETLEGVLRLKLVVFGVAGVAVDEANLTLSASAAGWLATDANFRLWNGTLAAEGSPWRPEGLRLAFRSLDLGVMSSLAGMERRLAGRVSGVAQLSVDPESGRPMGSARVSAQG
ncbi:MAG: AsmA family protein, partial [Elsteraceae bacterium]